MYYIIHFKCTSCASKLIMRLVENYSKKKEIVFLKYQFVLQSLKKYINKEFLENHLKKERKLS